MKKSDILSDSCRKRNFIPTLLSHSIKNLWFLVLKEVPLLYALEENEWWV